MKFEPSVPLQGAFAFSSIWYAAAATLIAAGILLLVHGLRLRSLEKEIYAEESAENAADIIFSEPKWSDRQCMAALDKIRDDFRRGRISSRVAWQASSNVVRRYVYSRTGIRVLSFTADDFRTAGMPELEDMIRKCYRPEFEEQSSISPEEFIERAMKIVRGAG